MNRSMSIIYVVMLGSAFVGLAGCGSSYGSADAATTYESAPLAQASPVHPETSPESTVPGVDAGAPSVP
jgi:hypothetical protein